MWKGVVRDGLHRFWAGLSIHCIHFWFVFFCPPLVVGRWVKVSPAGLTFSRQTACPSAQRGEPQDEHQLWVCSHHIRLTGPLLLGEKREKKNTPVCLLLYMLINVKFILYVMLFCVSICFVFYCFDVFHVSNEPTFIVNKALIFFASFVMFGPCQCP